MRTDTPLPDRMVRKSALGAKHLRGILDGMRTTIDAAGRLVVPKVLRDELGLDPGEVKLVADGNALRVEAVTAEHMDEDGAWLVISAPGSAITADEVRGLRSADQR